jgi:hypothetical protein
MSFRNLSTDALRPLVTPPRSGFQHTNHKMLEYFRGHSALTYPNTPFWNAFIKPGYMVKSRPSRHRHRRSHSGKRAVGSATPAEADHRAALHKPVKDAGFTAEIAETALSWDFQPLSFDLCGAPRHGTVSASLSYLFELLSAGVAVRGMLFAFSSRNRVAVWVGGGDQPTEPQDGRLPQLRSGHTRIYQDQ